MSTVGIRALKQNASAVVAEASSGRVITITDRGRAVAVLSPIPGSRLDELIATGRARPPLTSGGLAALPTPEAREGDDLSATLRAMRDEERY